jgi:hypothetical protein
MTCQNHLKKRFKSGSLHLLLNSMSFINAYLNQVGLLSANDVMSCE